MHEKSFGFKEINSFSSWWPRISLCLPNTDSKFSQAWSGSSILDIWNHKLVEIEIPINPWASSHLFDHLIFLSSSVGSVSFLEDVISLFPTPKYFVNCKKNYCSGEELKAKAPLGTRLGNLCELITLGDLSTGHDVMMGN